ncbi:MAG: hypothetical protein KGL37_07790 [Acidobacteriota bacterium]|nr:hypothetical protein [Acidobacteriota bacterium]
MRKITLFLPNGDVKDYPDPKEVNAVPGLLSFRNQPNINEPKGQLITTTLPFVMEVDIQL